MSSVKTPEPKKPPSIAKARANSKIKRYERKLKRLVKHADFDTIVKVYEKHPKLKKAKYKRDKKKYLKYLKKEYFLLKKALPKFAVTKDEFTQYQYFLMYPTECCCPDGIIQNNRKMYEIEKKWDQLAEHYNSYIYTPSKTLIFS